MRRSIAVLCALAALVFVGGCSSDRVEDQEGTVFLSVSDFDGLPVAASVNLLAGGGGGAALLQVEQIVIQNLPRDPGAPTSDLQNVEMRSYEVVYTRADTGTRVPTPLVRTIFGVAPVGGTVTYDNLVVAASEQLLNPPLSDLLFLNGAIDSETGSQVMTVEFRIRFFGRTIAGDDIVTAPIRFDVEFTP